MPAIPEFVLRKLYVADSLQVLDDGFTFELNNTFAPVTISGLKLTVDDTLCSPGNIFLSVEEDDEIPVGGISEEHLFTLAINVVVNVRVVDLPPQNRLVIRVDTREVGTLQFGVDVGITQEEPTKPKKANLFSRINRRVKYASQVFRVQQDPQHPTYHYSPPANWMNDPNGLIYWKGNVHLFYQYNPFEPVWGNIHWGHAVSTDMLRWKHQPIALWPDPKGADAGGCYSGCAVVQNDLPTIIYTAVFPEVQCIATSPTNDLVFWRKHPQPVIAAPPKGMHLEGFRDPCVWQEGKEWRMVLGSGLTDLGGAMLLYRSVNLLDWQYMGVLFNGDARVHDPLWTGTMWECPSFFPMGQKWVLIVSVSSPNGGVHSIYYVGQYAVDKFIPDGPPRLLDGGSGGCFYAPQTFIEGRGRRVMFGWLREARIIDEQVKAGWSGAMSLPRYLSLSQKGELVCSPSSETRSLRKEHEKLSTPGVPSSQVRGGSMEMVIRVPPLAEKWSGVHLSNSKNLKSGVLIGYDCVNSAVVVDCRHAGGLISALPVKLSGLDDLVLHVFVDGSIIEVYLQDQVPITARFYVEKPQGLRASVVGEAAADLWQLRL